MPYSQILDLHIHSKYSRACSKNLELPVIGRTCEQVGIDIVATGDFTHPAWFEHLKENLFEDNSGVYKLKNSSSKTKFVLGTELSVIKKDKGQTRRVHHCVFAPSLVAVEKLNDKLATDGFNLRADGRPILGLTSHDLLEYLLEVDDRFELIPAHAWTPWFGVFGSKGGYNSLQEAFGDLVGHIHAIETGLSSDPLMNRRCSWLDDITLVSNSDAHSPQKLGREANVLSFSDEAKITYDEIFRIINQGDKENFNYTIEFYPEEGKYHLDGHRDCQFVCAPAETKKYKGICPKCNKPLVIGVMNRVEELADRSESEAKDLIANKKFISYKSMVPLPEILADVFECGVATKMVEDAYQTLLDRLGSEFQILMHSSLTEIEEVSTKLVAEAIDRVRQGRIVVRPGYDGEFGVVKVFEENENRGNKKQLGLELD